MMFIFDFEDLRLLANEICFKYNFICVGGLGDEESRAMLIFSVTWIESFYHIDPIDCIEDIECIERVLAMHGEIYSLALENKYVIELDREKLFKAVERLAKLQQISNEIYIGSSKQ
jgi:hypothetical protein